ncbi:MAG: substrate-binding domain-containing protein [Bacteroidales bacterium]|nr:substrate-binding domain-containing protein [Bacteroidales bacterium]
MSSHISPPLRSLFWLALCFCCLLTTGCRKKNSGLRIGVAQCSDDSWRQQMNSEMQTVAATRHDVELHFRHAHDDSQLQMAQIDSFVSEGVNLIILAPNEADAVCPAVERAWRAGIPVVVVDRQVNTPHVAAYVGADNLQIGREAAQCLAAKHPEGGVVWQITGLAGSTPAAERTRGFAEEMKLHPQFRLLTPADGGWKADKAAQATRQLLEKGEKPDFVFAHNDPMAAAVHQVMQEHGLKPGIIGVDALDGNGLGLDLVEQGKLEATMFYPTAGDHVLDLALRLLDGKPYDTTERLATALVTSDNVGIFRRQAREMAEREQRINALASILNQTLSEFQSQRLLLFVVMGAILLMLALFAMALRAYWQKIKWTHRLETQNKLLEQQRDELVRMSRQVEEATQSKLNFFTNVSHDFRTPLTLIASPIEQLLNTAPENSETKQLLQTAQRNVAVMLRLVGQILDIRRIESGRMPMHLSRVPVVKKVKEWTRNFEPMAASQNIQLTIDTEGCANTSEEFWLDEEKVERILFNLLGNAFKFTPEGGRISVKISATLEQQTRWLTLRVADSGRGMTPQEIGRVFNRFYQTDDCHGGSGIGLTVAQNFAQLHGGDITVESHGEGKGSTFTVTLCEQPAPTDGQESAAGQGALHINPVEIMPAPQTSLHDDTASPHSDTASRPLLLVIDDNADIRSYLTSMLQNDFRTITAADGAAGLAAARKHHPDLIVCDMMMPVMDGMTCLKSIRNDEELSSTPVVMLTACALDEERVAGYEGGADAYIAKPFSCAVLRARLLNICENRRRLRELLSRGTGLPPQLAVPDTDKDFATQLRRCMEQHLADTEYGVEQMANDMAYSRTQLYRKVKELTGLSPLEIMKKARLNQAHEMLLRGKTPAEVAYATGFSSPSYFSKCYRAEYGQTPSETVPGKS